MMFDLDLSLSFNKRFYEPGPAQGFPATVAGSVIRL